MPLPGKCHALALVRGWGLRVPPGVVHGLSKSRSVCGAGSGRQVRPVIGVVSPFSEAGARPDREP